MTAAMRRQRTPKTTSHQGKPCGAEGLRRKSAMPLSAHLVVEGPFPVQGEHSGTPDKWCANPSREKPADRKRLGGHLLLAAGGWLLYIPLTEYAASFAAKALE